jgi:hypothetical protein
MVRVSTKVVSVSDKVTRCIDQLRDPGFTFA